ncbi:hypothetical protein Tco_1308721, partial [Tanacetum coccineum]
IMEYLVKINKKARILELKQRHLKILTLKSYTPYPSRKIRRIQKESIRQFNRMSRMDDDLFTYEVEIPGLASVPCNLNDEDDSEQ